MTPTLRTRPGTTCSASPATPAPTEIKAAWRNATDKFEPGSGSGQFRMFNEAADVLLDPERRAAYDASLDAERRCQPTSQPWTPAAAAAARTPSRGRRADGVRRRQAAHGRATRERADAGARSRRRPLATSRRPAEP